MLFFTMKEEKSETDTTEGVGYLMTTDDDECEYTWTYTRTQPTIICSSNNLNIIL